MADEKPKVFSDEPCSDDFLRIFTHQASSVIDCQACGRVHFYDPGHPTSNFDTGEYEKLKAEQEKDPDRYMSQVDDSTPWIIFYGRQIVLDCPCNYARRVEDFFWENRHDIAEYLKVRANMEKRWADDTAEKANEIPDLP